MSSETAAHTEAHDGEHVMPLQVYFGVFGALMVLTVLTVWLSYFGLGPIAIEGAMVVALIKASLVIGYFMHLKYEGRFLSLLFVGSLFFLFLLFLFCFVDLGTRNVILKEHETTAFFAEKERAAAAEKDIEVAKSAASAPKRPAGVDSAHLEKIRATLATPAAAPSGATSAPAP